MTKTLSLALILAAGMIGSASNPASAQAVGIGAGGVALQGNRHDGDMRRTPLVSPVVDERHSDSGRHEEGHREESHGEGARHDTPGERH